MHQNQAPSILGQILVLMSENKIPFFGVHLAHVSFLEEEEVIGNSYPVNHLNLTEATPIASVCRTASSLGYTIIISSPRFFLF